MVNVENDDSSDGDGDNDDTVKTLYLLYVGLFMLLMMDNIFSLDCGRSMERVNSTSSYGEYLMGKFFQLGCNFFRKVTWKPFMT